MGMILHIAEVAGLMFLAFVLGSALGYGARLWTRRAKAPAEAIPAARLAVAKGQPVTPAAAVPAMGVAAAAPPAAAIAGTASPQPVAAPPFAVAAPAAIATAAPAVAPPPLAPARSAPPPNTAVPQMPASPARAASAPPPDPMPAPAAAKPVSSTPVEDDIMVPARAAAPRATGPAEPADDLAVLHRRSTRPVLVPAEPASHPGIAWDGDLNGHAARRPVRVAAAAPPVATVPIPEPEAAVPPAANTAEPVAEPIAAAAAPSLEAGLPRQPERAPAPAPMAEVQPATAAAAPVDEKPATAAVPVSPSAPKLDEMPVSRPAARVDERPVSPSAKILFGEILPPDGQGAPAPVTEGTTAEAAIAREEILAAVAPEAPAARPAPPRPPLFADFTVPDLGAAAAAAPEPAGVDDRNWPEPAPPHPHLQPGAQIVEPIAPSVGSAPSAEVAPEQTAATAADAEDDAMRAIEGGWSGRRRGRADKPELIDVSSAVAAAQSAVQQVLAQTGGGAREDADRPEGLPRPRNGARDDLRLISGLSALDESTLNNLGIYHFDQIAAWSDPEVRWLEDHVFAQGRIGRENWQRQARSLSTQRPAPPPRFARS